MADELSGKMFIRSKALVIAGIIVALIVVLVASWLSWNNPEVLRRVKVLIESYGYTGVFISTIIAGTIIPFGSPIIVASASGFGLNIIKLALIATTGYTLGVLTSYVPAWIFGERYIKKKMGKRSFQQYFESWNKHGYKLCVLFSLIPGFPVDLLALACGTFHTESRLFIPICWITMLVQFLFYGWIGATIGSRILP
jgi:membrane protein YqaA with SNARE-associated domain